MNRFAYLVIAIAAGCQGVSEHPETPVDGALPDTPADGATPPVDGPPRETQRLGMNDISMVSQPPKVTLEIGSMTGINGNPVDLVPRALFARLVTSHLDILQDYEEFEIFSIRFDLCDRIVPGPCPEGVDGSLRLVFQPVPFADVGLHAFYPIPAAELGDVVNELRGIARVADIPRTSAVGREAFGLARPLVRALVAKYARADRLIRLSLMGQDQRTTDVRIVFRGLELQHGEMVEIAIGTTGATEQVVTREADTDPGYVVAPVEDLPAGFARTLSAAAFNATPADQRSALEALVATQTRCSTPRRPCNASRATRRATSASIAPRSPASI